MEERFKIVNKDLMQEHGETWLCVLLRDNQENVAFWLDCGLMDGYGNKDNFKTEDLYIDWDFNQYIFHLDYEEDVSQKNYQEDGDNIDAIQDFIDEHNDELVEYLRGRLKAEL